MFERKRHEYSSVLSRMVPIQIKLHLAEASSREVYARCQYRYVFHRFRAGPCCYNPLKEMPGVVKQCLTVKIRRNASIFSSYVMLVEANGSACNSRVSTSRSDRNSPRCVQPALNNYVNRVPRWSLFLSYLYRFI